MKIEKFNIFWDYTERLAFCKRLKKGDIIICRSQGSWNMYPPKWFIGIFDYYDKSNGLADIYARWIFRIGKGYLSKWWQFFKIDFREITAKKALFRLILPTVEYVIHLRKD